MKANLMTANISALANFNREELKLFEKFVEFHQFSPEEYVIHEGDQSTAMFFILKGKASLRRADMELGLLIEGSHFGELGLIAARPRAATIKAAQPLTVAKLTALAYQHMSKTEPQLAIKLTQALISRLGVQLTEMTDNLNLLLQQRSLPRKTHVEIQVNNQLKPVQTGTSFQTLLPKTHQGAVVVAGLFNNRVLSLSSQVFSDGELLPLTTAHWEGQKIYRLSVSLLLLEAAHQINSDIKLSIGMSMGSAQWFDIESSHTFDLNQFIVELTKKMQSLIKNDLPCREEWWTNEEASLYFQEQGDQQVVELLQTSRWSTVPLLTFGRFYTLSLEPLINRASLVQNFEISANDSGTGLVLQTDTKPLELETFSPYIHLMNKHQLWLNSMSLGSVGHFNQLCIQGKVSELIRVVEGFHEKHISQIADTIAHSKTPIKIICISGPSSSGKSTFIKRLSVQLQVNGIKPVAISLDDYYLNRNELIPDENGEFDFESLNTLNLSLLNQQIQELLNGQTIQIARFDFPTGTSVPNGGKKVHLEKNNILLLEGLHGLNPALLFQSDLPLFKIFIQPMASLPFDRLIRVNPSDVRLIRRIVRDRHSRGYSAADNIMRWPSVRKGERMNIYPYINEANAIFDTSLIYEISVLKVYADRYLLEVPRTHPAFTTAERLRRFMDHFISIYPDHVPQTSILREFIGNSGFEY